MRYFVNEIERRESQSTCFFEFQKGDCEDAFWLDDSVSIGDTLWDELNFTDLFKSLCPDFDYYGRTVVTHTQWREIKNLAEENGGAQYEAVKELSMWADECFLSNDVFTICGL